MVHGVRVVVDVLRSDLLCRGLPWNTLSLRVHLVAGAVLNWGNRQPTVVAVHLRFFLSAFLISPVGSFLLFGRSNGAGRVGVQGLYSFSRCWRRVLWGYGLGPPRFLASSSGFSLSSFFVTPMGPFLGQGSRLHLD